MVVAETAVEDDLVPSFGLLTAMKVYDTVITLTKNPVIRYLHFSAVKNCIGTPFLYPLWLVPAYSYTCRLPRKHFSNWKK